MNEGESLRGVLDGRVGRGVQGGLGFSLVPGFRTNERTAHACQPDAGEFRFIGRVAHMYRD